MTAYIVDSLVGMARWWNGLSVQTVDVDGRAWPVAVGGPADGEPLLLLHGFGASMDAWTQVAGQLCKKYRLIVPDLPAFGQNVRASDARDDAVRFNTGAQAPRLVALLDAMGVDQAHIVGNSMGGRLCLELALAFGARVRSVALLCAAGVESPQPSELSVRMGEKGENPLVDMSINELLAFCTFKPAPLPAWVAAVVDARRTKQKALLAKVLKDIIALDKPFTNDVHKITAPTLIIWGRHDRLIHVSSTEVLQKIPNSRVKIYEDVGHIPQSEQPVRVAREIDDFISAL